MAKAPNPRPLAVSNAVDPVRAPRPPLIAALAAAAALSSACHEPGGAPASPRPAEARSATAQQGKYATVLLEGALHVQQRPDFCGEACVQMALGRLGKVVDQDRVFDLSGVDPALGRGATTRELSVALERLGFTIGPVWGRVDAAHATEGMETSWQALHADLLTGVPSIVCTRYDERPGTTEHFRLILGYDGASDEVVYHEPAEADGAFRRMPRARMLDLWPLRYRSDVWTVIRLRLEPHALVVPPAPRGFAPADFAQHVMALRARLPQGFSVVVEPPFVVVGDDAPEVVAQRARDTVRWAAERLKKDFFERDPARILDVWLFKDKRSYEGHTRALFGDPPSTPYGYYSSGHGALVMNIATGGGTLVHELVHPFVEANLPGCPSWLNEGLGSLFEQSADREGHIVGLTNWRLRGLQEAIRARKVPSFEALLATSDRAFYDDDPGTNYAQARYLLYYLQEQGKLLPFYRAFVAGRAGEGTGRAALVATLGEADLAGFKRRWEAWVMGLRFPG